MAALVQTYSHETGTLTMLQTRPNSATGRMPSGQQQSMPQYGPAGQSPRATYGSTSYGGYRGSSTPVQQYAFQSTPSLNHTYRGTTSAAQSPSRDDTAILQARQGVQVSRPQPTQIVAASNKAAPDRYRRPQPQTSNSHLRSQSATLPQTANLPNTAQFYGVANGKSAMVNRPASFYAVSPGTTMDDMHINHQNHSDINLRRHSVQSLDLNSALKPQFDAAVRSVDDSRTLRVVSNSSTHSRNPSSDSVNSSRSSHSRPSSAKRSTPTPTINPSSNPSEDASSTPQQEQPKSITVPPRGSSTDAAKRATNPSPLSRPVTMAGDTSDRPASPAAATNLDTPAAKQLAAINQKGGKAKSKTSRLRRAFSFGSAAELRAAAGGAELDAGKNEASKLHKQPTAEEAYDAEQARIAEAQEASGLGSSIYGGRFFGGSTDNLSISSTASSASIMIRKMGRGMKKSTRSLAGLFRPKSVIGVPPPDAVAAEGSQPAVSMVTVEAETQRVNVNPEPQTTDNFPHLERNSLDASQVPEMGHVRTASSGTDDSARKSIVGGDRERAEVLAAVRKGILKRSGSASPSVRPIDASIDLPNVPAITDSPHSSAPSTPNDEAQGHRRTGSIALGSEDYFMTALRLRQDSKSAPNTPHGGAKRNATFSPRLIFHDTWPPQEYDRRGEIATCNRLTPMLAQQIKEELNTFKMEMEVHENSKIYTHFF